VARRWRLRNKLLLGLGLVVGCVGALIAGTAYGLSSYMGTMKTTDSKLAELLLLDKLKPDVVAILAEPADHPAPKPAVEADLRERLHAALEPDVDRLRKLTGKTLESWSL